MLQKIKNYIIDHKIIIGVALVVIAVGSYFLFKNKNTGEVRYVLANVTKGDVEATVTGTGQIESLDTVTLNPKASGDITNVFVKVGDYVSSGALIASIDARDAKIALENAKISLAKLTKAPEKLSLTQAQNSLAEAKDSEIKAYDSGWNLASSYFSDIQKVEDGINDLYGGYLGAQNSGTVGKSGVEKINLGEKSYYDSQKNLEEIKRLYNTLSRSSDASDIDNLINKINLNAKSVAEAVKNTQSAFDYAVIANGDEDTSATTTSKTNLSSWSVNSNDYVNNILSAKNTITNSKNSVIESQQSLDDLIAGNDELDIRSAQLSLQSKQNAYDNYFIRAPFSGTIASLTAKVGESSGSSIGTLITKQKVATITLNEVDIASVKVGQKAELSFDAIDGLILSGKVAEIDSVGTVSSGVVSYNVKISFDKQDDRIKPGMSVSASITTDSKKGVLIVSNSALKTKGKSSYVEIFEIPLKETGSAQGVVSTVLPIQNKVEVGLSNDTVTEIISGLKENDQIVAKTITGTTTTSSSKTSTTTNKSQAQRMLGGSAGGIMGGH